MNYSTTIFNNENVLETEYEQYRHRRAARVVVFDNNDNVAILHPIEKNWYGLPGGGVEEGETYEQGIIRECKEEIGCDIKIETLLGITIEYRKLDNLINESHGYTSHVVGTKGRPFADDETNDSIIMWMPISEAIHLMENTPQQENLYDQYCIERDLTFLKQALVTSKQ